MGINLKRLSSLLKIPVSVLFVFLFLTAFAGDPYRIPAGAAEAGMGFSCTTGNGFWSSFHNQALLSLNNSFSAGFSYENRFGLSELSTRAAAITIPEGKTSLGLVYSRFGYTDYKRDFAGLACGLKLSEKLYSGIQIDYLSERTTGYLNNQSITFEAGMVVKLTENTNLGIHLFNPLPNSLRKRNLPSSLRIGAGTKFNSLLFGSVEAEMSSGNSPVFRTGFEYEALSKFRIRGGFCTDNTSFSFGMGWLYKIAKVDIGFLTHEKLGITSVFSMTFKIK